MYSMYLSKVHTHKDFLVACYPYTEILDICVIFCSSPESTYTVTIITDVPRMYYIKEKSRH
jgi:hypothetical protein